MNQKEPNTCEIVRDLIVLYEDDACSDASKQLVQEHVRDCESCREILEAATKTLPEAPVISEQETSDSLNHIFKKTIRRWKRIHCTPMIVLAFFLVAMILLTTFQYLENNPDKYFSVASDHITITELSKLSTGDVYCTLNSELPVYRAQNTALHVPSEETETDSTNGTYDLYYGSKIPLLSALSGEASRIGDESYIFPLTATYTKDDDTATDSSDTADTNNSYTYTCREIRYVAKGDDILTIYKRGDQLDPATRKQEESAMLQYFNAGWMDKALICAETLGMTEDEMLSKIAESIDLSVEELRTQLSESEDEGILDEGTSIFRVQRRTN